MAIGLPHHQMLPSTPNSSQIRLPLRPMNPPQSHRNAARAMATNGAPNHPMPTYPHQYSTYSPQLPAATTTTMRTSTSVRPRLQRTAVPMARAPRRTRRRDGVSCCTTGTSAQSRPSRGTSRCTPRVPQPMSCPRLGKLPVAPSEPLALHDARIALQNAANA